MHLSIVSVSLLVQDLLSLALCLGTVRLLLFFNSKVTAKHHIIGLYYTSLPLTKNIICSTKCKQNIKFKYPVLNKLKIVFSKATELIIYRSATNINQSLLVSCTNVEETPLCLIVISCTLQL